MKNKYERLNEIFVIRSEEGKIHVLGTNALPWDDFKVYAHIIHDASKLDVFKEDYFAYREINSKNFDLFLDIITLGLHKLYTSIPFIKRDKRKTREFNQNFNKFQNANMSELTEAIKDIRIYQGTIDEVANDLGFALERVDTKDPKTYIAAEDTFYLRVKAHLMGADAIVHYQPGSAIGTPVKYAKNK